MTMLEADWLASQDPAAMLALFDAGHRVGQFEGARGPVARPGDRKLRLFACACCRRVWRLLTDPRSRRAVEVAERYADGRATERELVKAQEAAGDAHGLGPDDETSIPTYDAWACADPDAADAVRMLTQADPPPSGRAAAAQAALLREVVGNPFRPVVVMQTRAEDFARERGHVAFEWLTPTALSLARAADDCRDGDECPACGGVGQRHQTQAITGVRAWMVCPQCLGTGRIDGSTLDPARLAVLADALEEAGCDEERLLRHLRGWERCCHRGVIPATGGHMWDYCPHCDGTHWLRSPAPHVRGCWALDCVLGRG